MQDQTRPFQQLSPKDFLAVGLEDVAYVRHLGEARDGPVGIFAADGAQLAVMATPEGALAAARQHGMAPQRLH